MAVNLDKGDIHSTHIFRKYSAKFCIVATILVAKSRNELKADILN